MPVVAFIIGALVIGAGGFIVQRVVRDAGVAPPPPAPRGGLTSSGGRAELDMDVERREYRGSADAVQRSAIAGGQVGAELGAGIGAAVAVVAVAAGVGAAAGGFLGPAGAIIGTGLGVVVGAIVEAIAHESYSRVVRDSVKVWLGEHELPNSSAAIDAVLFRNGLLGAQHVWLGPRGELAIEVLGHAGPDTTLSIYGGDYQGPDAPFIPGYASVQAKQGITGASPGMLDGPGRRAKRRAFGDAARGGDLHLIEFVEPSDSWRTPGYIWFGAKWPLMSYTKLRSRAGFVKVKPTADNVDQLAAGFDRAAGVEWSAG